MSKFTRREIAAGAALAVLAPRQAWSQEKFPSRPVTLVVPFPPGGGTDVGSRLVAAKLSERWGQPVVVENKPGASGIIGADLVAKARPDGYTLLAGNIGTQSINPLIFKNMPYDRDTAFAPIAQVNELPLVLLVNPSLGVKSVAELVALVKSKGGDFTYASSGPGGSPHLAAALFEAAAGLKMVHVPYKGGAPAVQDLLGGHVGLLFTTVLEASGHVRSGKLLGLAISTEKRSPALPETPTIAESGYPGYSANSWLGFLAPNATPKAIIDQIAADVRWAVALPEISEKFVAQGATPMATDSGRFAATIATDRARYQKIVADNGIKAD